MADYTVSGFPNAAQSEYARIPKDLLPGDLWEGELHTQRFSPGLIAAVTEVAYVATVTIAAFNSGDEVGVTINGGTIAVTAVTDADATAALLDAAINAAAFLDGVVSSTVAGAVVTVTGALGQSPTLAEYSPDTTTAAVAVTTAAVVQEQLCFGFGVAKNIPSTTINNSKIVKPSATTDTFAGVLVRTHGSDLPADQITAFDPLYDSTYLIPGHTYAVATKNCGVVVEYTGSDPAEGDDVYWICTGTDAGKWTTSDGAVSQVTQGDVVFNATDNVGLDVDSLPTLFVASNTSDDQTATDLRDAWNASAQHAAVAAASIDLSGAESYIILTFLDDQSHTVTAYSPATADITGITNTTAAVAASAVEMTGMSWGAPSIPSSADTPARAFLRLSNP